MLLRPLAAVPLAPGAACAWQLAAPLRGTAATCPCVLAVGSSLELSPWWPGTPCGWRVTWASLCLLAASPLVVALAKVLTLGVTLPLLVVLPL